MSKLINNVLALNTCVVEHYFNEHQILPVWAYNDDIWLSYFHNQYFNIA